MDTVIYSNWQHLARIETQDLLDWARERTLLPEHFNHQPTGRFEEWLGRRVELLNFGKSWRIYDASPIEKEPLIKELRDRFYPQANSVLLYYYPPAVGIGEHTDKPVFNKNVVIINLVDAQRDLFGDKPVIKFRFGKETKLLQDGDVVRFNALQLHGLPCVRVPRYSISFRLVGG